MQKKTLAMACSAILGASAGVSPALAEVECPHPDRPETCRVTDGDSAGTGFRKFKYVTATDPGSRITGSQTTVTGEAGSHSGASIEFGGARLARVVSNLDSNFTMNGGEITTAVADNPRERASLRVLNNSALTLNDVLVTTLGWNEVADSTFTMAGGQVHSENYFMNVRRSTALFTDVNITSQGLGVLEGSTFTGKNLNFLTDGIPNNNHFAVQSSSTVELTDSTFNNYIFQIDGSTFNLHGGSITSDIGAFYYTKNSDITLNDVAITTGGQGSGLSIHESHFDMTGGSITSSGSALSVSGDIALQNVNINSGGYGIWYSGEDTLKITDSKITSGESRGIGAVRIDGRHALIEGTQIESESGGGIFLWGDLTAHDFDILTKEHGSDGIYVFSRSSGIVRDSTARLGNGHVRTFGNYSYGFHVIDGGELTADNVRITTSGDLSHGVLVSGSTLKLDAVDIAVHSSDGLHVSPSTDLSRIDMTGGSITVTGPRYSNAGSHGIYAQGNTELALEGVVITTLADDSDALYFAHGASGTFKNGQIHAQGRGMTIAESAQVEIDNSTLVTQSTALFAGGRNNNRLNLANSTLAGDHLLQGQEGVLFTSLDVEADNSQLFGHARSGPKFGLTLNSNSTWTLRPSSTGTVRSDVTMLALDNSSIRFDSQTGNLYQSLVVGANAYDTTEVYHAGNNAQVSLNTWLNDGGALSNQHTDRLLIYGDVSGRTLITINEVQGSPGGETGSGADKGISIVQASGHAQEDSFTLAGGYITMNAQPYRYELMAYGPGSSNGAAAADTSQRLVNSSEAHWDWRLQSQSVAPQVPSYLDSVNALLKAARDRLRELRRRLQERYRQGRGNYQQNFGPWSGLDDNGAFVFASGGSDHYSSSLNINAHGANASITHSALQAGRTLYAREGANSLLQVGLSGSSGSVSFLPAASNGVYRTRLDQQSIAPRVSWHGRSGGYVDAILDYGHFKGKVSTAYRGETARLRGSTQTLSVETGIPLSLGGWTLEPQAQIALQRAKFENVEDVDGFPVHLGAPQQWTLRVGGEVHKALFADHGRHLNLYGRMHLTHGFDQGNTVWLGDAFQLGGAGNTLESSLGLDAALRGGKTAFYGDITRQQYLGGVGGWSANLGVRMGF